MKKVDAVQLAYYVLIKAGPMSHLKLQKVLFYIQAYHLALFNSAIVDSEFEAWPHGPVNRQVWDSFKSKGILYGKIEFDSSVVSEKIVENNLSILSDEQIGFINSVINGTKPKSDQELESLTHSETPWIDARGKLDQSAKSNAIISKESMKIFYSKKYEQTRKK